MQGFWPCATRNRHGGHGDTTHQSESRGVDLVLLVVLHPHPMKNICQFRRPGDPATEPSCSHRVLKPSGHVTMTIILSPVAKPGPWFWIATRLLVCSFCY